MNRGGVFAPKTLTFEDICNNVAFSHPFCLDVFEALCSVITGSAPQQAADNITAGHISTRLTTTARTVTVSRNPRRTTTARKLYRNPRRARTAAAASFFDPSKGFLQRAPCSAKIYEKSVLKYPHTRLSCRVVASLATRDSQGCNEITKSTIRTESLQILDHRDMQAPHPIIAPMSSSSCGKGRELGAARQFWSGRWSGDARVLCSGFAGALGMPVCCEPMGDVTAGPCWPLRVERRDSAMGWKVCGESRVVVGDVHVTNSAS